MSEYTPTTDEMRAFYTAERLDGPRLAGFPQSTVEQAEAEFDRWLNGQGEPSDAQVEGGCVAFYEGAQGITSWARLAETDPQLANRYRDGIRAALRAAATCETMSDPQRRNGE